MERSGFRLAAVGLWVAAVVGLLVSSVGVAAGAQTKGAVGGGDRLVCAADSVNHITADRDDQVARSCAGKGSIVKRPASPQDLTRGFRFYNSTGYDVKLTGTYGANHGRCGGDVLEGGGPAIPTTLIRGGGSIDVELIYDFAETNWCNIIFEVLDGHNPITEITVNVGVSGDGTPYAQNASDHDGTTTGWAPDIQGPALNQDYTRIELLPPVPSGITPATWMHDLAPHLANRTLSDILIPGSHDAASYSLPAPNDDLWHTQSDDLIQQLNDGMRELDIRVEYRGDGQVPQAGYYAHHGGGATDGYSQWLTLSRIFSDIESWATAAGHSQEVIILNLSIDGVDPKNGANFPVDDCRSFGTTLGSALVSPVDLQSAGLPTDPGQVTLGQLWSLPDPTGAARVIMDNSKCMTIAKGTAWYNTGGLIGSYYADQCTADGIPVPEDNQKSGITRQILAAVKAWATQAGGTPDALGSPQVGGLYVLYTQGTGEVGCLYTPTQMVPADRAALGALYGHWQTDPAIRANLNIISGDFVQNTNLYRDVITMDASFPTTP